MNQSSKNFGHTTKSGKSFANPQIGRKYESDEQDRLSSMGKNTMGEDDDDAMSKPTEDAVEIHIHKNDPDGKDGHIKVTHSDGSKSKHEFEHLGELKEHLDKFFNEESNEFKENPEEEGESHKGSLGDGEDEEDDRSNPFTDYKSLGLR